MVHLTAVWVHNLATAAKKCGDGRTWHSDFGLEFEWSFAEFRLFESYFGQETETPPRFLVMTMVLVAAASLALGKRADINIIDIDKVGERQPQLFHDFPGGTPRFI